MKKFAATLRKTGFSGDLVLAIDDETSQRVIDIVYNSAFSKSNNL
jgi:hypothetical protein